MRKILSALLSISLLCTTGITAYADETQTVSYDSTVSDQNSTYSDVQVEAERAELYSVTIPKTITLDVTDTTATYDYTVSVLGEISTGSFVRVIPLAGATIIHEKSETVLPLDVTQEVKRFAADVVNLTTPVTTGGTFTAENVTPGKYAGNVRYLITLDDGATWKAATCTEPATRIGVDADDSGVIEDTEVDTETVTRGVALGHKFTDSDYALPATCERCKKPIYAIRTPEQLVTLSNNVNSGTSYKGAKIELVCDIDMTGITDFVPIGNGSNTFKGNFEGNGYQISNLDINVVSTSSDYSKSVGLFGSVGYFDYIRNFSLKNVSITCSGYTGTEYRIGTVIGSIGATTSTDMLMDNIHIYNSNIQLAGETKFRQCAVGGFIGDVSANETLNIKNCSIISSTIITNDTGGNNVDIQYIVGDSSTYDYDSVYNTFVAIQIIANKSPTKFAANATNCVLDSEYSNRTAAINGVTLLTTAECKSDAALTVLNTDNTATWTLDLEGAVDGYPVIRS